MKAVTGLGNPGMKYAMTKHNVGFRLIDTIVSEAGYLWRDSYRGKVAEGRINGERVFFLKPGTYMNLSGLSVEQLVNYYKIPFENLLIVHDDMDLPVGRIRLRAKGSSGGHNGLKSIIGELGTQDFWRLKIGVGRPGEKYDVVDHVLSTFSKDEEKLFLEVIPAAVKAIFLWLEDRGTDAMNIFN